MSAKPSRRAEEDQATRKETQTNHRSKPFYLFMHDSMERINQAIRQSEDLDRMLENVLQQVLEIFSGDRAWILYPCDPHAAEWKVPMEKTQPKYPGAFAVGVALPMTPAVADIFRTALKAKDPVTYQWELAKCGWDPANRFGVLAQISMAIYPRKEKPWLFGIHQCSHMRTFSHKEQVLFKAIGNRICDALSSLLIMRDLKESRRFLNAIVENIPDVLFVKDAETFRFMRINKAGEDLLDLDRNEMIGKNAFELFSKAEAEAFTQKDREVLSKGETIIIPKVKVYTRTRGERILHTRKIPILSEGGKPDFLLEISKDVTDLIRSEKEQKKLQTKIKQAEQMETVGTLAGGVAHDLNNVLSGIVSYPDLILMQIPEESPLRGPIITMQESGQKAARIVQDLLTLSRRGVTVTEVVNLNDIIREYLRSPEFEKLKMYHLDVRIESHLADDLLNMIGSPIHLSKTVMNLVSNAAEAMPDGGRLTLHTKNCYIEAPSPAAAESGLGEGEYIQLGVSDTGIGISKKDLQHIYEPFYTKKKMGRSGTGLGMAVVWGSVEDHRGHISIESVMGRGTTFTIYFPATRKEPVVESSGLAVDTYMGQGQTILVVDDVKEQRMIARMMLTQLGYKVQTAASGEAALEEVQNQPVDLLILDMIMDPGMDGLETYERILRLHPHQRAIIASGFSETDRVKAAQRLGAGIYVKKPYTMEMIGRAVKSMLERPTPP